MTDKGIDIKAELITRPNATNGKYRACKFRLVNLALEIKDSDIFHLEMLQMKANFADKIISEAESQGKDTTDPNVMKELGEKINAAYTPIPKSESVMTAVIVSFRLIAWYGIAIGIWGLVFKKSILMFGFYGVILGLLISLLSAPIIASKRTKESIRDTVFGAGFMWGSIATIIGVIGLAVWAIMLIFFST